MTKKTIQVLTAVVIALVLLIVVAERTDESVPASAERVLMPEFAANANSAEQIRVLSPDADPVILRQESGSWISSTSDDYAVDIGKLRPLIVALAEASVVEEKTSNPEHYENLGVDDPENGGKGTKVVVEGEGLSFAVILGESAQGDHRYARLADEAASFLIDRNPSIPREAGDWLLTDLLDIDSGQIRSVSITHNDGETIVIEKTIEDQTDFDVLDIPEGRDLSYATVANGIAGTLGNLSFDDVRKATDSPSDTVTVFETWEGLKVTAEIHADGEDTWVAFLVSGEPEDKVTDIGSRLDGWQYKLPDFKKNLLIRRWDDILKSVSE